MGRTEELLKKMAGRITEGKKKAEKEQRKSRQL